jgi:hypothetical protein
MAAPNPVVFFDVTLAGMIPLFALLGCSISATLLKSLVLKVRKAEADDSFR